MKIPISKNWFGPEEFEAIKQPLLDGWVVQGKQVKSLEAQFCARTGTAFSIACSSGTAALHIAVCALGVKPGEEVVVPAFTWVATPNVVELLGGDVRFCDIELETYNSSPSQISHAITEKTVGVLPVHLFGLCADMPEILKVIHGKGIWCVEDAACGLGAQVDGKSSGSFGDAGCYSFHPRKSITTGEGGMLTTHQSELARHFDALRNHGALPPSMSRLGEIGHSALLPEYSIPGFNYRLTDIQAALGVAQMNRLDWLLHERSRCAAYYEQALADLDWLRLPKQPNRFIHAWQSYVTLFAPEEPSLGNVDELTQKRNELMRYLESRGVSTRQGTHAPAHLPFYQHKYNIRREDFPNAFLADKLTVALPVYPGMTENELAYVCESIRSFSFASIAR